MRRSLCIIIAVFAVFAVCASGFAGQSDRVTQYATIDSLLAGGYDGIAPMSEVLECGETGLGTLNHLAGELVILDGKAYQVKVDGKVYDAASNTTPFAVVCPFVAERTVSFNEPTTFEQMKQMLDATFTNELVVCAFRMDGTFNHMKTRSVPEQEPPYRPLGEVVKEQAVFEMENVRGTVVGFRCPSYMTGVNVPGYHFHFLTEDRTQGGHILDFEMETGECAADQYDEFLLKLPQVVGIMSRASIDEKQMNDMLDVIEK